MHTNQRINMRNLFAPLVLMIVSCGVAARPCVAQQTTQPAETKPATTQPAATPPDAQSPAVMETRRIEALLEHVATLDGIVFIRNGGEHTAAEAAAHLQRKWRSAGDAIKSAEMFIDELGSASSSSGQAYRIRLADGNEVDAGPWLHQQLDALEGKTLDRSDPRAIEIADEVMQALGGSEAWANTRYITWRFFGTRLHVWDKQTGDIRVEFNDREGNATVILMNLHTRQGNAFHDGVEVDDETDVARMLEGGYAAWVNDSYWLVMPYKLRDPGVTLSYIGEGQTLTEEPCDIIDLTFDDGVGLTPGNRYRIYVSKASRLVEQWDFYRDRDQEEADFSTAWKNWQKYGNIMLSDDRGEMRGRPARHTDVAVFDELPRSVFESAEPADLPIDE
ncbi:MAG: DUF5329 family protein [Phycisphaerales bacterium]